VAPLSWVVPLAEVTDGHAEQVGGKALQLARLREAGLRVPRGFVVSTDAYVRFVEHGRLGTLIHMELARKDPADMRWEELWDAALRLRRAFLAAPLPPGFEEALAQALAALATDAPLAVRSSALGEDGSERSFAGLHETVLDVRGLDALVDAIKVVWASLWSDAALLYRRELGLDVARSRMAVLVQPLVEAERSGVAFGRDPREPVADREVIEVVPGRCADLVDGVRDPQRFVLERSTGRLLTHRAGEESGAEPLLQSPDLERLHRVLGQVEDRCGWPPDVEWTGRRDALTVLQARPLTGAAPPDDARKGYLALKPGPRRLEALRAQVVEELIPALTVEGERLAAEAVEDLDGAGLAAALEARAEALDRWRRVYEEAFIPFAHGVRALATLHTDLVRPDDPYAFLGLLAGEDLLAGRRNAALATLAEAARSQPAVGEALAGALREGVGWEALLARLNATPGGPALTAPLEALATTFDVAWEGERLQASPAQLLQCVLAAAERQGGAEAPAGQAEAAERRAALEAELFAAAGPERADEVARCLETARLSWRLRDDDNLLLGRVESQLLRAVAEADRRLRGGGRLSGPAATGEHARALAEALRDASAAELKLPAPPEARPSDAGPDHGRPRQLSGQPAAPGLASGLARVIHGPADLPAFRPGEVLVCDAIQPQMTHLVPLACAVIERRGGMLIHGAIIARELGLPCVNGVPQATQRLRTGDLLTVDGHLGVVTVGEAELRWRPAASA
jgi:pyruvate,water dikinase